MFPRTHLARAYNRNPPISASRDDDGIELFVAHSLADSLAIAGVVAGRVLAGDSLTQAMRDVRATGPLRSAVKDLTCTALRDFGRSNVALSGLLTRKPTPSLHGLLLASVSELAERPRNPYAVVHQAVEAAARVAPRNPDGAKSLVNAVLRNFLRQQDVLLANACAIDTGKYRHPAWWVRQLQQSWPRDWEHILVSANTPPKMVLRANIRRFTGADYLARLHEAGIDAELLDRQTIVLPKAHRVDQLPDFAKGAVSIQDWGAQLAAVLLDVQSGMRVLDACAAPGGKSGHIGELSDCELYAVDIDSERLARVQDNLHRLDIRATVLADDLVQPVASTRFAPYDRILADVPCTASGVVRRHPDIKWLRRQSDIERFAQQQRNILASLWNLLAPSGRLLYATCSVFPQENEAQITAFLNNHSDARRIGLPLEELGVLEALSWRDNAQLLPGPYNDGFFYALLEKQC